MSFLVPIRFQSQAHTPPGSNFMDALRATQSSPRSGLKGSQKHGSHLRSVKEASSTSHYYSHERRPPSRLHRSPIDYSSENHAHHVTMEQALEEPECIYEKKAHQKLAQQQPLSSSCYSSLESKRERNLREKEKRREAERVQTHENLALMRIEDRLSRRIEVRTRGLFV